MQKEQTVYYNGEDDDFEGDGIKAIKIDDSYKYIHDNLIWKFVSFILYRLIATPIAYIYVKFKYNLKIVNKEVLKKYKKQGYFMYANHTQVMGDAFIPSIVNFPKKVQVVVHPNNVSIPFWGNIIKFLGALPIPNDVASGRNFISAISSYLRKNNVIMIYPEAHVWSYYTKIRNFSSSTFKYPIKENMPTFAMTITYKKRKFGAPRIIAYIDGPFFAKDGFNIKEKQEDLKTKVYDTMKKRALNNDVEYIKYKPKNVTIETDVKSDGEDND